MEISTQGFRLKLLLSDCDSEGWMDTEVGIDTDVFKGGFFCQIEVQEWRGLISKLESLYSAVGEDQQAEWSNMESNIELQFKMNSSGQLEVEYRFCPSSFSGPYLSGEFTADQSYLPQWIKDAKEYGA
jgi:hypothetical protein